MLQGDTGKFITNTFTQLQDKLGAQLTVQLLLGGAPPEKLQKLQADAAEAPKLLDLIAQQGFVAAVEVRRLEPPEGQLVLVLPDAGAKPGPLFGALRLAATLASAEVKEQKIGSRSISNVQSGPVQLSWWAEGKHALVVVGTDSPEAVVKQLENKEARLSGQPLLKKVQGFMGFETSARGFVDVAALIKLAKSRDKAVAGIIDELGLDGLRSLTFYSGFDGLYERSLTEWEMPGPRQGALKLLTGNTFRLADVPPLPPDIAGWSMTNFNSAVTYDVALKAIEGIVRLVQPEALPKINEVQQHVRTVLGIDLRNDLLANLGDQLVTYSSPAEGPLSLGQTIAIKVKDGKKVLESLQQAIQGVANAANADLSVKKREYRGAELYEVHFRQQGFVFLPTFALIKDWLVIGMYPQAVQGFVLRASGELPVWKPEPRLQESLDKMPKEFIAITVSDPVPSVKQILSLAPLLAGLVNSFAPDTRLDVGGLPNAHEATRHLFPNVTLVTDDGTTLRQETRASLGLPLNVSGLDSYGVFFLLGFARGF
jgi:hypothetical protein